MPKATSYSSSKLKQWEKDRRERLNVCFRDLASLLPSHDPAVVLSKVQILQKAAKYIRELQGENRLLVEDSANEVSAKQVELLRERSDHLLQRVQQLVELLQDAGIPVPSAISVKGEPFKGKQLKWDGKIKPENAKILEEKAKTKKSENRKKVQKWTKKSACETPGACVQTKFLKNKGSAQKRRKTVSSSNTSSCPSKTDRPHELQQSPRGQGDLSVQDENARPPPAAGENGSAPLGSAKSAASQHSSTSRPTCFVEPKVLRAANAGRGKKAVASVANSRPMAPAAGQSVQTCSASSVVAAPGLVPGTIIFASGSIVPVLPGPRTVITAPAQYIMNAANHHVPVLHKPPVVVVQKNPQAPAQVPAPYKGSRTFPLLVPKKRADSAKARFPNKVPISASASRYLPLQVQPENANFLLVKSPANKKTVGTLQVSFEGTTPHKQKFTGNVKRCKVAGVQKSVDKKAKVTKQVHVSSRGLNKTPETCSSKRTVTGMSTELEGKLKVTVATRLADSEPKEIKNLKKANEDNKIQEGSIEKVHGRTAKKRTNSNGKMNGVAVTNKKLKVSQTLDTPRRSSENNNMKSVQDVSVSELGSVAANTSSVEAGSQQILACADAATDSQNITVFQCDSSFTVSVNLSESKVQQGDCAKDSDVPPDRSAVTESPRATIDDKAGSNIDIVSDMLLEQSGRSLQENDIGLMSPVTNASVCVSNDSDITTEEPKETSVVPVGSESGVIQDVPSSATCSDSSNVGLHEASAATVTTGGDGQSDLCGQVNDQNSGGKDINSLDVLISVCERDSNSKLQDCPSTSDKSATSDAYNPDKCDAASFSLPEQSKGSIDGGNPVKEDCEESTSSAVVVSESLAGPEQDREVLRDIAPSSVSPGPVSSSLSSGRPQDNVCVDEASKKNMRGIYTIDALCKTSVSETVAVESLEKDIPESASSVSGSSENCTTNLQGSNSVVNSCAVFMRVAGNVTANERELVSRNGVSMQVHSCENNCVISKPHKHELESNDKKSVNDKLMSELDKMNTSQKLSQNNESSLLETMASDERISGFSSCGVNMETQSVCGLSRSKYIPTCDKADTCQDRDNLPASYQRGEFAEGRQTACDDSWKTERISLCAEGNSAEVSISSSNSIAAATREVVEGLDGKTPQDPSASSLDVTSQGRGLSDLSTVGENIGKYNKRDTTSQSPACLFATGTERLSSAANLHTLPPDASASIYAPSDVYGMPASDKSRSEAMRADVSVCGSSSLHGHVTDTYEKATSVAEHVSFNVSHGKCMDSKVQTSVPRSVASFACTSSLRSNTHNPAISAHGFTAAVNTPSHSGSHLSFPAGNERCTLASQSENEPTVSVPTTFMPGDGMLAETQAKCPASGKECSPSLQQKCNSAAPAPNSFAPVHALSEKQPCMMYSTSDSCNLPSSFSTQESAASLPSFTSVVNTLCQTQPRVTCSVSNDKYTSLLQKYEPALSSAVSFTSAVQTFSQAQSHTTFAASSARYYSSVPNKNESVVSGQNSFTPIHALSQTQPLAAYPSADACSSSGHQKPAVSAAAFSQKQSTPPQKQESSASAPISFPPVHTFSHPLSHPSYVNSTVQHQTYESAISAPSSFTSVHSFSQTQPCVTSFSSSGKCNLSLLEKHNSAVSAENSFAPIHTFSQTPSHTTFPASAEFSLLLPHTHNASVSAPNSFAPVHTFPQTHPHVTYSSSNKCNLLLQQKHESTVSVNAFTSLGSNTTSGQQTSAASTTNSFPYLEREFPASTFAPVSQIVSDIRTHPPAFSTLNSTPASHSWLPTSCGDKSWLPVSKSQNSMSLAHRKTGSGNETSSANLSLQTNEFASDIFATLQVPSGGQHPESISPTAAFLLAFPLVSGSKVSDMIDPQDVDCDSLHGASSLLQIGNIDHYSTSKKDASIVSSAPTQQSLQPSVLKCSLSGKGRTGAENAEASDKPLTDRDFYLSSQLSFVQDSKQNMVSKNGINSVENTDISSAAGNNVMGECAKHDVVNRSVGTQFKSSDICETKPVVTSNFPKTYMPTTVHTPYSSANVSGANSVPSHAANVSVVNSQTEAKSNSTVGAHPLFSSAGVTYDAVPTSSFPSHLLYSQDKLKKNSAITHFPIVSDPGEMREMKWTQHKNDDFDKQNTTGSCPVRKPSNFSNKDRSLQVHSSNRSGTNAEDVNSDPFKTVPSSQNSGATKFESSQTRTISVTGTSKCDSLMSNPSYSHNLFQGSEYKAVSSQAACFPPTYGRSRRVANSSSGCASFTVAPWTTSVTNVSYSSASSTAQSVVSRASHQGPTMQYSLPRPTDSATNYANTYCGADPGYLLPSGKQVAPVTDKQDAVGSSTKNVDGAVPKLGNPCGNKFGKICEQKVAGSGQQHMVADGLGLYGLSSFTSAVNSETLDTFKFPVPPDQHQAYQQHAHRPPVNWMTSPAVSTNQSKQTFGTYFPVPSSMNVQNSSHLDSQQLRNNAYFAVASLDTGVSTLSTSSCYGNKVQSQNALCQVKTLAEKQQNTGASVSYASETQNDSSRVGFQNNATHVSQVQQNEFYSAPWNQLKPPFPTNTVSSDMNNLFVPSTLPTLVGDLALGTGCIMNTMEENNANKSFSNSNYNDIGQHTKEQKLGMSGGQMKNRQTSKESSRKSKHNVDCAHEFANLPHAASTNVGGTFLSVSQLVDPIKSARGPGTVNSGQALANDDKLVRHQNAGSCAAKRETLRQGGQDVKDNAQQLERPHNVGYHVEAARSIPSSEQAKREGGSKGSETLARNALGYQSAAVDGFTWLPTETSSRKQARAGGPGYKTQLSTYSAEALIGTNQNTGGNNSATHKVISLPPPVVSDRFDNPSNYGVGSHFPRKMPYADSTIAPGNYNIRPLDLPVSQDFTVQSSPVVNRQSHQTYPGGTQQYSAVNSLEPSSHGRENTSLCPPYFTSSTSVVRGTNPNPAPQGFATDPGGRSCGLGPQDSKKFPSFPTFSFSKESCPPKSEKQNSTYSQSLSSAGQQTSHVQSKIENSAATSSSNCGGEKVAGHNNRQSESESTLTLQNATGTTATTTTTTSSGNSCFTGKQRGKKRGPPDAATSAVSSIGNLVDLGYLTMPPGVGSPLLGDDGMYFGHAANFHGGPPALYPPGPPNPQGTFYAPPRGPFPPCPTTAGRSLQQATVSPNANTGGTTLANFNLSTIFPEIVDKQAASVSATEFPTKARDSGQHGQQPPTGACAAGVGTSGYLQAPPNLGNAFPHANLSGTRSQWL